MDNIGKRVQELILALGFNAVQFAESIEEDPDSLNKLMREMNISDNDPEHYLFSTQFNPGPEHCHERLFSKFWDRKVRKDLDLPMSLKFYSFKDTGITNMIRKYNDPIIARDQARHHDLSITNMYTPFDTMQANERIKADTGEF